MARDTTQKGHERLRADARRNRDQIVATARTLFVTRGVDTPMEEIASQAGVGVGTLYRRFPDREALIQAVALDVFQRLASTARAAWEEEPDAWSALRRFLRHWAELRLGMLYSALCPGMPDAPHRTPELRQARQTWLDLLDRMVAGAQGDGAMRRDIGSGDIAAFMNVLIRQPELPAGLAETRGRLLELLLDGLHVYAGSPLPGRPITSADLDLSAPAATP